jgi:hypothetical protein
MADYVQNPIMDCPDRAQSFNEFRRLANLWFNVKKIQPMDQHSYIILWSGREGLKMFNTWELTEEQLKDPVNLWTKFSQQIEPPENFRIHIEFQRFKQLENESVDDFFTRCKTKVKKCKFRDDETSDERVIEVIISGIKYHEIQKRLLSRDNTLTLTEAYEACRTHEASAAHMAQFTTLGSPTTNIHAINRQRQNSMHQHEKYEYCGRARHSTRNKCPASGTQCSVCKKIGHWGTVGTFRGRVTERQPNRQPNQSTERRQDGQHRQRTRHRQTQGYRSRERQRSRSRNGQNDRRDIHIMTQDMTDEFQRIEFSTINMIDSVTRNKEEDEVFAKLNIKLSNLKGTHCLQTKVDTGAQGNLLPVPVFRDISGKLR